MLTKENIEKYAKEKFGSELKEFSELGKGAHGTGFLVELKNGKRVVFKTLRGEDLGHEYPADRAQVFFSAHFNYNKLPQHVKSLDVGAQTKAGLKSIGDAQDFFLVMEEVQGIEYREDMDRILKTGKITEEDKNRAKELARYLAKIHSKKHAQPSLYKRRTREAVAHNELMMGVIDLYPKEWDLCDLVKTGIDYWAKLKNKTHRLCQVHGDFYYGNIVFTKSGEMKVLDRSRGEYGEAAEDVACILINYVMYALRQQGKFKGPFKELAKIFFDEYLALTKDEEIKEVLPLYFISRSVIVCCPVFYPNMPNDVRASMFNYVKKIAQDGKFEI